MTKTKPEFGCLVCLFLLFMRQVGRCFVLLQYKLSDDVIRFLWNWHTCQNKIYTVKRSQTHAHKLKLLWLLETLQWHSVDDKLLYFSINILGYDSWECPSGKSLKLELKYKSFHYIWNSFIIKKTNYHLEHDFLY